MTPTALPKKANNRMLLFLLGFFELHRVTLLACLSFSPARDASFGFAIVNFMVTDLFFFRYGHSVSYGANLCWCKLVCPRADHSDSLRDCLRRLSKRPRSLQVRPLKTLESLKTHRKIKIFMLCVGVAVFCGLRWPCLASGRR